MNSQEQLPLQNSGSAIYSPFLLRCIYNLWVLWISNSYSWCCPTNSVLLPFFRSSMGPRHLDLGVGTGYYPAASIKDGAQCTELTLLDMNLNSLQAAKRRVLAAAGQDKVRVRTVLASATETLPFSSGEKFDSVSMFYLLHCLSGPPEDKTRVFDVVRAHVAADGVAVGATILGEDVSINWFARRLMQTYNGDAKIFDNWRDSQNIFHDGLCRNFEDVDSWVVGQVMLFRARRPRQARLSSC
ncbi:hypothetical protein NQ176_g10573 [Zarea fungicola]|uniref:Uncharacterized protein n=1 Tax=Zarea fungicola TaxID=93591 RepID=A0ACC1MG74_9HYPO|nr:hypothetical protein NQ176_g10573 [Lecanicillium fungicola]